jgi:uncharacterized protein YbjT (DUF2867 family)
MTRILITAATGNVGRTVCELLADRPGLHVRALARDAGAAALRLPSIVDVAVGDFSDPASLDAALEGVDAVYVACGNVPEQVDYESMLVDRAAAAGVSRLVKLSARGAAGRLASRILALARADPGARSPLGDPVGSPAAELPHDQPRAGIGPATEHGSLFAPAGNARISMVDPRDVAAVAAAALVEEGHLGRTYVVTGPEAISYDVVAASLAEVAGGDVTYVDVTPEAAEQAMLGQGLPPFVADQLGAVFTALRGGGQSTTTDVVASVTGRAPRSFLAFARNSVGATVRDGSALLATESR